MRVDSRKQKWSALLLLVLARLTTVSSFPFSCRRPLRVQSDLESVQNVRCNTFACEFLPLKVLKLVFLSSQSVRSRSKIYLAVLFPTSPGTRTQEIADRNCSIQLSRSNTTQKRPTNWIDKSVCFDPISDRHETYYSPHDSDPKSSADNSDFLQPAPREAGNAPS